MKPLRLTLPAVIALFGALLTFTALSGTGKTGFALPLPQSPNPPPVVINEVAWGGTAANTTHEWIELYNNTANPISLIGWRLYSSDGKPNITLSGTIPAFGYYLIERGTDTAVADIPADLVVSFGSSTGAGLSNSGEVLTLTNHLNEVIDTANTNGGPWPAGITSTTYCSMERIDPAAPDTDANWASNNTIIRNGSDANGNHINGTPKAPNSVSYPNLWVVKEAHQSAIAGSALVYTISVGNAGVMGISDAWITDNLPHPLSLLAQSSPFTFTQASTQTLVWQTGPLAGKSGLITNSTSASTILSETAYADNYAEQSTYIIPLAAQMVISKTGPLQVIPGHATLYTITLSNLGVLSAEGVLITDVLPYPLHYFTHTAPYPLSRPSPNTLVWDAGTLPPRISISWTLTVTGGSAACGRLTNTVTATTTSPEPTLEDNAASWTAGFLPRVVIDALLYDGYQDNDGDEAFRLYNLSPCDADLGGWCATDREGSVCFPAGAALPSGKTIWCARNASAFAASFGFSPDWEYRADTDPNVPQMTGQSPAFANSGDELSLLAPGGIPVDAIVYKAGNTNTPGWSGPAVQPYTVTGVFAQEGQILYRKREEATGLPMPDTDTAVDWAQDPNDPCAGRKALYPGWNLDAFFFPVQVTTTAQLTLAVGPDHLYEAILSHIQAATRSLEIASYSLDNPSLTLIIADKIGAGVTVTVLLEGNPAGGLITETKWAASVISNAGGTVYFLAQSPRRYRFQHAKYIIVDGRLALLGTENFSAKGMPPDDKANGTYGQRGLYLITDAPPIVQRLREIFATDTDPSRPDIVACSANPMFCAPPPGFAPTFTDWTSYTVRFPQPLALSDTFYLELAHSPENALRCSDGLMGLLKGAGPGDTVLVEQLYEQRNWGNAENLRLQAYLDAARRGAAVRILLDDHYNGSDNAAVVGYINETARTEGLDLQARLANPMGAGLHNKMVLARMGGKGYAWVGSVNGSETSFKANREMGLLVQSDAAYQFLAAIFQKDWEIPYGRYSTFLPITFKRFKTPSDLLITEVLYDALGDDTGKEWVEIYNPTSREIDLSGYKLGDAQRRGVYEAMYRFPEGTRIGPGKVILVAETAAGFASLYSFKPDYELVATDPAVPDLIPYTAWSDGPWRLANSGDEVLLLGPDDSLVDAVVYGSSSYPGVNPHPGGDRPGDSLMRDPPSQDTDNCATDFRVGHPPTPGSLK